uniref:Protein-lysine N-methyltransferase SMYD4 n=1 Tax=Anopheles stephensi TaxID=30069 RepID=A0A182Y0H3_ANOST
MREWLRRLPNIRPDGEALSDKHRTNGNVMFKGKSSNHLVLQAYNRAIFAAPCASRALALGHANRAIVLIRLGRYREAYEDCQLALDGDYPEEKRLKVYFRQAECAESMNDPSKLGPIVDGLSKLQADPSRILSKGEREKLQTLQAKYDAAEKRTVEETATPSYSNFLAAVKMHVEPFSQLDYQVPSENCVTPTKGRHAIAQETLHTDHIISRETAVSFVPVYDPNGRTSYHCQKCARVNVIPFPCSSCGGACYCSIQCRADHRQVHRFECAGYQKRLWYFIGIAHLGIRSFLDGFDTIRSELLKVSAASCVEWSLRKWLGAITSGGKDYGQYGKVLRLVTNFHKMDPDDVLRYAMAALMLSIYLMEFTPFLSEHGFPQEVTGGHLPNYCAALIMRHIGQLVCNGHAISELSATSPCASYSDAARLEPFDLLQEDSFHPQVGLLHLCFSSARIFTAIYPQISMFNHACNPNIRNHFDRSTLTVYATRLIAPDSEVVNCYGPHYKLMSREMRLMHLKQQYCFDCTCDRCQSGVDTFLTMHNAIRCSRCWQQFSLELSMEHLQDGKSIYCAHCSAEIDTDWYGNILQITMNDDPNHLDNDFRRVVTLYEWCAQTLVGSNQTRADVLEAILHRYTRHAVRSDFWHSTLRKYAIELASIRREQYNCMSLEYLTGCFYLLDLWALLYLCNGSEPVQLKKEEKAALKDFRAAIGMIGVENRLLILEYAERFVILDEETPEEEWIPVE